MEFNERTKAQIVNIQINTIMEYLIKFLEGKGINPKDVDNIQKMFNIVNGKNNS